MGNGNLRNYCYAFNIFISNIHTFAKLVLLKTY